MRLKTILAHGATLALSIGAALLLSEFAVRQVVNPSDFLSVEMVEDPVLGATPGPRTRASGFDAWGFRNRRVPDTVDVVALGDSHTYGNTAAMADSWPYVLERLSGLRTYNMGLGGYGPNQYLHLLKTKALTLKPKLVVVGLYMGDDFENAFLITYGLDYWKELRALPSRSVNFDIWEKPQAESWHKKIRLWLSRNSVVYKLVVHGPMLGRLQGEWQIRNAHRLSEAATTLSEPGNDIMEAFLPAGILRRLDQQDVAVREGMRLTFSILSQMNEECRRNNAKLLVTLIPTKETVFVKHLASHPELPHAELIAKLHANEAMARERTIEFLKSAGIDYVDTTRALQQATGQRLYARTASDMHPSRNGYHVIAAEISRRVGKTATLQREPSANP